MDNHGNFVVSLCHEVQQARPAEDGHYLHIEPPRRESDGNDSFAELMMYANVTRAHDYFKSTHGMDWLDFPLPALVNVQFKIEPPVAATPTSSAPTSSPFSARS
jgi:hypothetical protein